MYLKIVMKNENIDKNNANEIYFGIYTTENKCNLEIAKLTMLHLENIFRCISNYTKIIMILRSLQSFLYIKNHFIVNTVCRCFCSFSSQWPFYISFASSCIFYSSKCFRKSLDLDKLHMFLGTAV